MIDKLKSLPITHIKILKQCGTEYPYSGLYNDFYEDGSYLCRRCGLALFRSCSKFNSSTGWPSFDDHVHNHVKKSQNQHDSREEILCNGCSSHLGHIFYNEGFTMKSQRYCVNSLCLDFVPDKDIIETSEGIFAGGCFWGIEALFQNQDGVLLTECGYIGGRDHPTYDKVCRGNTGDFEAVRVLFDHSKVTYENLLKYFFEIHNPFQFNGQGVDLGPQYRSAIFYFNSQQKEEAENIIELLESEYKKVATSLLEVKPFWRAEDEHQNYFHRHQDLQSCHIYTKRFDK